MHIAVFDLGIGNLRSVEQALQTVAPNATIQVTSDSEVIANADRVVLPGQGAIGTWFTALHERELGAALQLCIATKPLLGICVGMQALFDRSEEDGGVDGLGVVAGEVRHFSNFHAGQDHSLKIPQMGWNQVEQTQSHPLWHDIDNQSHFYFVHSYCANTDSENYDKVQGTANFGHEFVAAVGLANIFAVQFHPEKSHNDGLQLLKNFTEWNPDTYTAT